VADSCAFLFFGYMKTFVKDILTAIDSIAPWDLAESWDNSGLQVGDIDSVVHRLGISLDVTPDIVDEAIAANIDCLLTHHPFFFKPLKMIDFSSIEGRVIYKAAKSGISIISAHTNFDIARSGLNDVLAEKIGLCDISPMIGIKGKSENDPLVGIGRIGQLPEAIALSEFALQIKKKFGLSHVRYVGNPDKKIKKISICSGSGGSLIRDFFENGSDLYISGDLKYHEARDTEARGKAFLDIGHFASEIIMIDALAKNLKELFKLSGHMVEIIEIRSEKEPFVFL